MPTPGNQPPPLTSEGRDPQDFTQAQKTEEIGRLQSTFQSKSFSDHPSTWDSLWNEDYTPWDRGGPSLALNDIITRHGEEYFPHLAAQHGQERPKALVPGCGRGHDVLLLSQLGYDAYGLDFSERAVQEAKENEMLVREKEEDGRKVGRGKVTWAAGDFFDETFLSRVTGVDKFDLIFDYTFFCALPIDGRPRWAKRIASLLKPGTGRLVCLEWPLHKAPKTGGPPWGVTAQVYTTHLAHPGKSPPYDEDGNLITESDIPPEEAGTSPGGEGGSGLERIARIRPTRTHKAGYDPDGNMIDFISVWRVHTRE